MENKPLSAYSQIVSYAGAINATPTDNLESTMHHPQPEEETGATRYDQAYEEAESILTDEGYTHPDQGQGHAEGQDPNSKGYQSQGQDGRGYHGDPYEGESYQGQRYEGHAYQREGYQGHEEPGYAGYQDQDYEGQAPKGHEYGASPAHAYQGHGYYEGHGMDGQNGYAPIQGGENQSLPQGQGYNQGQDGYYQGHGYQGRDGYYQGQGSPYR